MSVSVAVLMTCFNRKQSTLACLQKLAEQTLPPATQVEVYLTDDGSKDGTAQAVLDAFPGTHILTGDGNLYWSGGMRKAWAEAFKHKHDFYLWLNDDTLLYPDALKRLLETYKALECADGCVISGSTQDPATGELTYGGVVRPNPLKPTHFEWVTPTDAPLPIDTINGNCVLVPHAVTEKIGGLSEAFTHSLGDFDYGLRARAAGCSVWLCPGYVGVCKYDHPVKGSWKDSSLSRLERWRVVRQVKSLPPREWRVFTQRHAGPLWPAIWALPYLRIWLGR